MDFLGTVNFEVSVKAFAYLLSLHFGVWKLQRLPSEAEFMPIVDAGIP
jgi:hypothetical protein